MTLYVDLCVCAWLKQMPMQVKNSNCEGLIMSCGYMYVCREVLSVSTRKGTEVCEVAQKGFIFKISVT